MSLKKILMEDLKDSMKNKNTIKKNTITMVRAAIQQEEIDTKKDLSEDDILSIISKEVKDRRTSIEEFKKGDRQDLIDTTEEEIEILLGYLPEQLSEEELERIVKETIEEVGAESMRDMGKIMGSVMPKIKGRADGNMVNKIVQDYFK